jgi:hypothetical protein
MIDSYHLYIDETRLLLRRQTGLLRWRRVEPHGEWKWDASRPLSLNLENLGIRKKFRSDLHVYVGSGLSKFMAIALPPGLQNAEEERAAGQAQVQHQLGLNASEWVCAVDAMPAPNKSVVCAVRRSLLERLQHVSDVHGFRLASFKPFVAGIWNTVRENKEDATSEESVLMVVENDAFTVLFERGGVIESISALSHGGEPDLVEREIKRVGYALGAMAEESVRLAVSRDMRSLANSQASRILLGADYLSMALYADFRDLLFASCAKEVG